MVQSDFEDSCATKKENRIQIGWKKKIDLETKNS